MTQAKIIEISYGMLLLAARPLITEVFSRIDVIANEGDLDSR